MSLNNYSAGANNASEYMVSPIPWITASVTPTEGTIVRYDFDTVASTFFLRNRGAFSCSLAYGWSAAGVTGSHRGVLDGGESIGIDVRFKSIFLMSVSGVTSYELLVGLTGVTSRFFPELSGSGYNGVG